MTHVVLVTNIVMVILLLTIVLMQQVPGVIPGKKYIALSAVTHVVLTTNIVLKVENLIFLPNLIWVYR